jgi:hypothetical protein
MPEILVNKHSKLQTKMENGIKYKKYIAQSGWLTLIFYINEHDVP